MPKKVLALIEAFAREEVALRGQQFLAPLAREGRARLRVLGMVYALQVLNAQPGWWVCRMLDSRRAEVVAEALPWQRGEYLALWPTLRLVLLEPVGADDWLALPFNPSDASQRFGMRGPLIVRLVEGGQPFERVVARIEGATAWYDEPDRRADPATAEALRAALAEAHDMPGVAGLGAGERAAYELLLNRRIQSDAALAARRAERHVCAALELGGARLLGYTLSETGMRVTWEHAGQRHVAFVGHDLGVVSAGICLSGQDAHFDLTSLIGIVEEAPDYARWQDDQL